VLYSGLTKRYFDEIQLHASIRHNERAQFVLSNKTFVQMRRELDIHPFSRPYFFFNSQMTYAQELIGGRSRVIIIMVSDSPINYKKETANLLADCDEKRKGV
jgi:hypothetical protein